MNDDIKRAVSSAGTPPSAERHVSLPRPIYRTTFAVTEELYPDPGAKEPCYSRTLRGSFGVDLRRLATLCGGILVISLAAAMALRK